MNWIAKVGTRKRTMLLYGLLLVPVIVMIAGLLRPRTVMVAPVTRDTVAAEVEGDGTVTVDVLANIGARISGRIDRGFAGEGDLVRRGQLIATVDATDLRRHVERAEARLGAARAAAWQSSRAWERERTLLASGAVSQEEADQYEERDRADASAVQAAEADLRYEEYELSEAEVSSLVSGVVTKRWVEPGDAVVVGQPIATVADTSVIYVAANVDQRFSGRIRAGQPATVILRGREGQPYRGRVYRVEPQADRAAEEMVVDVAFPLPPRELQIGQWAEVYVTVGEAKNALAVPKAAILPAGNSQFVFVIGPHNRVRRVPVQPRAMSPRLPMVAVTGDLKPGDRVILRPMGLSGGETVRVTPAPADEMSPQGTMRPQGDMSQKVMIP